jgi:hypothetical protein
MDDLTALSVRGLHEENLRLAKAQVAAFGRNKPHLSQRHWEQRRLVLSELARRRTAEQEAKP